MPSRAYGHHLRPSTNCDKLSEDVMFLPLQVCAMHIGARVCYRPPLALWDQCRCRNSSRMRGAHAVSWVCCLVNGMASRLLNIPALWYSRHVDTRSQLSSVQAITDQGIMYVRVSHRPPHDT